MKFAGRTATAIIISPPNKVLLIKRRTFPFKGYLALPGVRINLGEIVEQAIAREVKEETGLTVTIIGKISEYQERGVQNGLEYDYNPTCFLVKKLSG